MQCAMLGVDQEVETSGEGESGNEARDWLLAPESGTDAL